MNETPGTFGDWGLLEPLGGPDAVVGDDAVLAAMVDVERALLIAWSREAGAPEGLAEVAAALSVDGIDRAALLAETRRSGVAAISLVEQLRQRAELVSLDSGAWLHRGATSQDIVDTALVLVAHRGLGLARRAPRRGGEHLAALAEAEADTVAMGRTLSQHATPLTFGSRVAGWLDGVTSAIGALGGVDFPVQLAGPVGDRRQLRTAGAQNPEPGHGCVPSSHPNSDSTTPDGRGRSSARRCCTSRPRRRRCRSRSAGSVATSPCSRRTEVGELIPGSGGGSSSMPHKHNPVAAVLLTANGLRAPGLLVDCAVVRAGRRRASGRGVARVLAAAARARAARRSMAPRQRQPSSAISTWTARRSSSISARRTPTTPCCEPPGPRSRAAVERFRATSGGTSR